MNVGAVDAPVVASAAAAGFALDAPRPNPFSQSASIAFTLPRPTDATVRVVDVGGRVVRTIAKGKAFPTGRHQVEWDGLDEGGRAASNGVYFVTLVSGKLAANRRVVILR